MHTPFDELWLAELLAKRGRPDPTRICHRPIATVPAEPQRGLGQSKRRQDWARGARCAASWAVPRAHHRSRLGAAAACRLLVARAGAVIGIRHSRAAGPDLAQPLRRALLAQACAMLRPRASGLAEPLGFLSDSGLCCPANCAAHGACSTPPRAAQSAGLDTSNAAPSQVGARVAIETATPGTPGCCKPSRSKSSELLVVTSPRRRDLAVLAGAWYAPGRLAGWRSRRSGPFGDTTTLRQLRGLTALITRFGGMD